MCVFRRHRKSVATMVAFSFFFLTVFISPVKATMIDTSNAIESNKGSDAREKVRLFMNREDVKQQLVSLGVDVNLAQKRITILTDEEVAELARRIDELPAGGDALGALLGVVFVMFLILLVTDILGLTDVFPFVRKY